MWVFTLDGFFSIVAHTELPNHLLVRARDRDDIQRLAGWLARQGHPVEPRHTPEGDYAWRLVAPRALVARYLATTVADIDYPNFKNAVAKQRGHDRAVIYSQVWLDMLALQPEDPA
jgi:hypothetical protein